MSKKTAKKTNSVTEMANDKLVAEIATNKKELLALRFKNKLGELTDTSLFKKAKKQIARAVTELTKRNKGGE